jgi:hypothetical protein
MSDVITVIGQPDDEELLTLLRDAAATLERHPRLVEAIVSAFVAEGRAYASTEEGAALREAFARWELLPRVKILWEAFGLDRFVGRPPRFRPSRWIATASAAASHPRLERILSSLLAERSAK